MTELFLSKKLLPAAERIKEDNKMNPLMNKLNIMFEQLSEQEQLLVINYVMEFLPDDAASPEDIEDIKTALEEYNRGEYTDIDDIDWN